MLVKFEYKLKVKKNSFNDFLKITSCSYKGVSFLASAFHWNPLTRVVIGLFLFVAFSIPFRTPATKRIAGFDTNPFRLGFELPALKIVTKKNYYSAFTNPT